MPLTGVKPVLEVIIVNYNAGEALAHCVQSVLAQQEPVHITVVDNASTDDSLASLHNTMGSPENLSVIANGENLGFARAVNAASRNLGKDGKYLLILNPDCEMLPGSLADLCSALDGDPRAVLAGPAVVDRDGQAMRGTLRRFPDPWSSLMTFSGLWRLGRRVPAFKGIEMSGQLPPVTAQA